MESARRGSQNESTPTTKHFVRRWADFWSFLPFAAMTVPARMRRGPSPTTHTPDDIRNPNPPKDDQPYAGVLYLDSMIYANTLGTCVVAQSRRSRPCIAS